MSDKTPRQDQRSIEDNYPDYLDDEFGYGYRFFDQLTQSELARHDKILHADAAQLEALGAAVKEQLKPDPLELFALTRAWWRLGEGEQFRQACGALLKAEATHPGIAYAELSRRLAWEYARAEDLAAAYTHLDAHLARYPEDLSARRLVAIFKQIADPAPSALIDHSPLAKFLAEFPQDAELRLEIAEDLYQLDHPEDALFWLKDAHKVAQAYDPTTLVDVLLVGRRLFPLEPPFTAE